MDWGKVLTVFTGHFIMEVVRYLIAAGLVFLLVWVVFRQKLMHRLIQKKFPPKSRIRKEFLYSMSSMAIFSAIGLVIYFFKDYSQLYKQIDGYGWPYFVLSIPLAIIVHDTYFYWTHRLMHHPKIYKRVHLVHHQSTNPSPWAAYSFHPFEAVIQGMIGPILIFCIPFHPAALIAFGIFQISYNVVGHLSFELFQPGFTKNKWTFWHNTTTHHNMHHRYFTSNFSIYFNWWDRIGGTLHPKYDEQFEEVTNRPKANTAPVEAMPLQAVMD